MSDGFDLTRNRDGETSVFIQWKGTDVCLDFTCECGTEGHFDGYFAYVLECSGCGKLWEMPMLLYPRPSQRNDGMPPVIPRDDE